MVGANTSLLSCAQRGDAGSTADSRSAAPQPSAGAPGEFRFRDLEHRFKNALALVLSIVKQSRNNARTIDCLVNDIERRIDALARTHCLAFGDGATENCFKRLVEIELAAFAPVDGNRVYLAGAPLKLDKKASSVLPLVLHELVTNAVKHGCLSAPKGRLEISWTRNHGVGARISWIERGGPTVHEPASLAFGANFIRGIVESELDGCIEIQFAPEGLNVTLSVPDSVILPVGNSTAGETIVSPSENGIERNLEVILAQARILVVEDNLVVGLDLEETLQDFGAKEVILAGTINEALNAVEAGDLALAILDFDLGNSVSSAPVAEALATARVPFVFLSGYSLGLDVPAHLAEAPVLNKPVSLSDLREAVSKALTGGGHSA